jgi:hypothetical protein
MARLATKNMVNIHISTLVIVISLIHHWWLSKVVVIELSSENALKRTKRVSCEYIMAAYIQ